MTETQVTPRTILKSTYSTDIRILVESFLVDRKTQNLQPKTVDFYREKFGAFLTFCESRMLKNVDDITPDDLRYFLLWLADTGHNPGGIMAYFRTVRAFLNWFENEYEPENWKNPIRKVKPPKVAREPIQGIETTDFEKLVSVCTGRELTALRDKALFLFLLDTGARAAEVLTLNLDDCDNNTGKALIRQGKGRKPRTVFYGRKTRKAIRIYLNKRTDTNPALWITDEGDRLEYSGLRFIIVRRSRKAGLSSIPSPHDFRRAFALGYLRNGGDIFTLQKLMGHADIQILRAYLAQTDTDTQEGHARFGPVDKL